MGLKIKKLNKEALHLEKIRLQDNPILERQGFQRLLTFVIIKIVYVVVFYPQ